MRIRVLATIGFAVCYLALGAAISPSRTEAASPTGQVGDWEITITGVEQRAAIRSGPRVAFGVYLVIYLDARYTGKSRYEVSFTTSNLRLIDSAGRTLGSDLTATLDLKLAEFTLQGRPDRALAGETIQSVVVFDVPGGAEGRTLTSSDYSLALHLDEVTTTTSSNSNFPWSFGSIPTASLLGYEDGVGRMFVTATNRTGDEAFWTFYAALKFDTPANAASAMPGLAEPFNDSDSDTFAGTPEASEPVLGDESLASMAISHLDDPNVPIGVSTLVVRQGALLRVAWGIAVSGDPSSDILAIETKLLGRTPGPAPESYDADRLRIGGLWDCLPRLADLPAGYVRVQDLSLG